MIIARLSGGLGNQLFQYALGRALSLKNKDELKLDTHFFGLGIEKARPFKLSHFNISAGIAQKADFRKIGIPSQANQDLLSKILRKIYRMLEESKPLPKRKVVIERRFDFDPDIMEIKSSCYLSGVWQSEKYFKDSEDIIRKEFTLKNNPSAAAESWMRKAMECNSVSIHIRRGDYVEDPRTNRFHGVCSPEYYARAISLISQKIKDPIFFIFSDDIDWVKDNFKISHLAHYVSDKKIPDYEELIIMSRCRHHITANSTFSWWGAWLNENKDKIVIAPEEWFKVYENTTDLLPDSWIKM